MYINFIRITCCFKGVGLDPNHTHFIFVDDGSTDEFGKEQELRGQIEKKLYTKWVNEKSDGEKGKLVHIFFFSSC